jgi:hypothetical protein
MYRAFEVGADDRLGLGRKVRRDDRHVTRDLAHGRERGCERVLGACVRAAFAAW